MIAVTLGLLLTQGISMLVTTTAGMGSDNLRQMRATQDVRAAADLFSSEIRQAGYWSGIGTQAAGTRMPFGVVRVSANCVLYSYDDTVSGLPYRGFRLNGNTIEWLRHATNDADFSCASASLDWQPITDPTQVAITTLTFIDRSRCVNYENVVTPTDCNPCNAGVAWLAGNPLVNTRQVEYVVTGRPVLGGVNAPAFTMNDNVVSRNEEYGTAEFNGPAASGVGCGDMISLLLPTSPL